VTDGDLLRADEPTSGARTPRHLLLEPPGGRVERVEMLSRRRFTDRTVVKG
jgi:hypothetical protein